MSNVITYNANGIATVQDDVKFTLKLSSDLNEKVKVAAKEVGLSKLAYIRFILSQSVNK